MTLVRKQLIVPTAINLVTALNESIRLAYMQNQDAKIYIPSLIKRARIVYDEAGVLPVQPVIEATSPFFTK